MFRTGNMLFSKFSVLLALLIVIGFLHESALAIKKTYIVHLGEHSHGLSILTSDDIRVVADSHTQFLASYLGSEEKAREALIYSYNKRINGFAARLEEEEAVDIAKSPDVATIFLDQAKKLHTTHSWDFLMLEKNNRVRPSSLWAKAKYGQDVIVANLDTGVWPESKSFSGEEYGPIPSNWKGTCQLENKNLCNGKLIGARYFNKAYLANPHVGGNDSSFNTARDDDGHGSHTLSTAAGNFVPSASVFGVGNGTAKGGSPKARVAAYKVCWPPLPGTDGGCFDGDITKAIDAAIYEGVDVLSVSLGGDPADYFQDGIAVATFHAVRRGIVVVCSAGNSGPKPYTVSNVAPWILTVGASTLDREFEADVKLGTGEILKGASLSTALPQNKMYPFVSGAHAAAAGISEERAILCENNTLDSSKAKGKIVVCLRGVNARMEKGAEAARAGAAGMILCNDESTGNEVISDPHMLPATHINYTDGLMLFKYVNKTKNPVGLITPPHAVLNLKPAPFMAPFSSRGPNLITPEILKPDITAPGVAIIAAYSGNVSASGMEFDHRITPFNTESGTSMSCPHVAGVTGLLKSLHPEWSPAAIKSAIMTTARTRDNTRRPMLDGVDNTKATPFSYGAGHIRPNRAMDPGLIYDLTDDDYLDFLCGIGYNQTMLQKFSAGHTCPKNYSVLNFNYPSITIPGVSGSVTVTRKLKNVGKPGKYGAIVRHPPGYRVTVEPSNLSFGEIGEEQSFSLTIVAHRHSDEYKFGGLVWSDGIHYVRSPIVVSSL